MSYRTVLLAVVLSEETLLRKLALSAYVVASALAEKAWPRKGWPT